MNEAHESLREHLVIVLGQLFGKDLVIAVPQGIAILSTSGRHTLIRIDDATLEVNR